LTLNKKAPRAITANSPRKDPSAKSLSFPAKLGAQGLPRHGEGKDPLPLLQDKHSAAAGMETARQQLLDKERKTQCHYAPQLLLLLV